MSISIFTAQLRKAKLVTNQTNARAAYAAVIAEQLDKGYTGVTSSYDVPTAKATVTKASAAVSAMSNAIDQWTVSYSNYDHRPGCMYAAMIACISIRFFCWHYPI